MTYLGSAPALRMVQARKVRSSPPVGCFQNARNPIARREKWSSATAVHQQNGHARSSANGSHGTQKPTMGTAVRSTCQMCLGQAQPGDGAVDGPAANFRQGQSRQGNGVQHGGPGVAVPVFA